MSLLANSNAIETGGYQISRSVRLRSSASAYLNRTLTTPTNNKIFTYSLWAKRGTLGSAQMLLSGGDGSSNNDAWFGFNSSDQLVFASLTGGAYKIQVNTSAVFRDPSAFYSIVLFVDNTQATNSNGIKIYVNGVNQTLTYTTWVQNGGSSINTANPHYIGRLNYSAIQYLDGYLTEINFIDGQALTPSSFGQTDTITGSWVAKKYTGTYGTNGFYLNFSDNSAATSTTIGKDYSGNGNNWTPNNISVTAGTTYDSMLDVPSGNGYADGGNGRGNYSTLNPLFVNNTYPITYSNGNLNATRASGGQGGITNTFGMSSGKWYWEVVFSTFTYNIGITTNPAGSTTGSEGLAGYNGGGGTSIGFQPSGVLRTNGTAGSTYTSWTTGDVMAIALDMDGGNLYFYKNGTAINSGSPVATSLTGSTWFFITSVESGASLVVNFGQRPFSYTPPTGFKALNTQNLPDATIKNGAGYMAATLYAGSSSAQSITNTVNGVSFQPDLVWGKNRSNINSHRLTDSVRGVGKVLFSNDTAGDTTGDGQLASFNSNGWTFTSGAGAGLNESGNNYVAWNWKANGTGVSNTAGTITSTVSANTTAGFSVVTWTGNGTNGATVGHGLGVAPKMVIVKRRSDIENWGVYHASLPSAAYYLILNSTAAQDSGGASIWNSTAPTSTLLTLGTSTYSNANTSTYVAYCFAAVAGYSAFGSYTGNGSTDGPFVYCGFRPRFFMIKRTDTTTNWIMYDTARQPYNTTNPGPIYANLSSAEESNITLTAFDILSNGFKPRNTSSWAESNASGGTYIYAAFGDAFKFSNAR